MGIIDDWKTSTKSEKKYLVGFLIMVIAFAVLMIVVGYNIAYNKATREANTFVNENCYNEHGQKYGEVIYENGEPKLYNIDLNKIGDGLNG